MLTMILAGVKCVDDSSVGNDEDDDYGVNDDGDDDFCCT